MTILTHESLESDIREMFLCWCLGKKEKQPIDVLWIEPVVTIPGETSSFSSCAIFFIFSLYIFCITYVSASPNPADAMSSLKFINDNQNCVGCEKKDSINMYTYNTWYRLEEQAKKPVLDRLVWLWPINCTFSIVSKFGCFLVINGSTFKSWKST